MYQFVLHGSNLMVQVQNNSEQFQQVYDVLRDLAAMLLSQERTDHTLQPTALVNEAFLKLENGVRKSAWNGKAHFKVVAATAMRQILVDHARQRNAQKRGGDWKRITFWPGVVEDANALDVEELDEALKLLATFDLRKSRVVELRFFGGLTGHEIANELNISPKTVEADWYFARAWLRKVLSGDDQ